MLRFVVLALALGGCVGAQPTDLEPLGEASYNPLSPSFKWNKYSIAAATAAAIVAAAGLAILTTLFFPMFIYKICYALGGCQNTLDSYVDQFLGIDGRTRRIKRRDLRAEDGMLDFLKMAIRLYGNQAEETKENVTKLKSQGSHLIDKRSPLDYIEPVLMMMSKAYNEYVDPELKKNSKKPPSIR